MKRRAAPLRALRGAVAAHAASSVPSCVRDQNDSDLGSIDDDKWQPLAL